MDDQNDDDPTPTGGWEEVRCPQCAVVVQPTWDWCHSCGYDPEGLSGAAENASQNLAADIPGDEPSPPPDSNDDTRGGRFRRRRYRT